MPRFFPFLIAFIVIGAIALVALFLRTGPLQDQARSPDVQTREQVQLPK